MTLVLHLCTIARRTPFCKYLHAATALVFLAAAGDAVRAQVPAAPLPPAGEYVTAQGGHLSANGQRVRLCCIIGGFPNMAGIAPADAASEKEQKRRKAVADTDALAQRFESLGFNGTRLWSYAEKDYARGDGSDDDVHNYFVSVLKQHGMRIWAPAISQVEPSADAANAIYDPATAPAWKAAMLEAQKKIGAVWMARVWDARPEEHQRRGIARKLNHFNLYTSLRVADDPVYAVWDLTNEEWWMSKMVGGAWQDLPKYFQDSLSARWHLFLCAKYGSEEKLAARWGFLLPGESLDKSSIRIAPLAGGVKLDEAGMDARARRQMELSRAAGQPEWTRADFKRARGEDVLEFFLQLHPAHKKRLGSYVKLLGKGARLSPLLYDTGIGYEIQSQFLHQSAAAVAHDAYVNGWTRNPRQQLYLWFSDLEEWPRIAEDVPWLEHNRVEGKPFLCYETPINQPAKYRSEFPLRLLALASIQDWDAGCWHFWGGVPDIVSSPRPFEKPLDVMVGSHPQGYHFTCDEVQAAMMHAAGWALRNALIRPAPSPTTFIFGRHSLYDPASMDYAVSYGKSGLNMLSTTYQYGVHLLIDPTREDDEVRGPVVSALGSVRHTLIRPNEQITFDTRRGGLTFAAPGAAALTGFLSRFGSQMKFRCGVTLRDVQIAVPPAMPYKDGIAEEKYISVALVSLDGRPMETARRATLSLVSTSFNTGFKLGRDDPLDPSAFSYGIPPGTQGGGAPVLVARRGHHRGCCAARHALHAARLEYAGDRARHARLHLSHFQHPPGV